MSAHMSAGNFEDLYREHPDPWGYQSSEYERQKYAATLAACGPGPFAHALELGGSIGVFSALLAPRCARLTTLDFAPSAVTRARARLQPFPQTNVTLGRIPEAIPDAEYDLVVASEILYYLEPADLSLTLDVLERRLTAGGRLVAVHWRAPGPERPASAAEVHAALIARPCLRALDLRHGSVERTHELNYLLDVVERRP